MRILFAFAIVLLLYHPARCGGGFLLELNNARYLGAGNIGVALSYDPASIYYNPGALSFVRSNSMQLGSAFVRPLTAYRARTPILDSANTESSIVSPLYFYLAWRKKNSHRITFGLGFYTAFGYKTGWPDSWSGRFIVQNTSLITAYIQPTLSYRVDESLGIGIGFIYGLGEYSLRRGLPFRGTNGEEGWSELNGSGDGIGFNVGLYYKISDRLSLGAAYLSSVQLKIDEGTATFNVQASLQDLFPNSPFSATISLPDKISMGFSYRAQENFILGLDLIWTGWSKYDSISIASQTEGNTLLGDGTGFAKNFQNAFSLKMGGEYTFVNRTFLRGGLAYDQSPVKDGFVSPELPDANSIGVSIGLGTKILERLQIDGAYVFKFTGERTALLEDAVFGGKYESTTQILSVGINYTF